MEKHAFLIIAHNNFGILKLLLQGLDHPNHDVYLHIDKKVKHFDFRAFQNVCKKSRVFFCDRRINVKWGHQSQVLCEMLLFETAYQKREYAWFHLLSGVDFPLVTAEELDAFFAGNKKSYLSIAEQTTRQDRDRISYYRFRNERIDRLCLAIQKRLGIRRVKNLEIKKGANWASLTEKSVGALMEHKELIRKMTFASSCADEVYKQTVLWNFARDTVFYEPCRGNLRYTDWSAGGNSPKTLDETDYEKIVSSGALFARKLDEKNSARLIRMLLCDKGIL